MTRAIKASMLGVVLVHVAMGVVSVRWPITPSGGGGGGMIREGRELSAATGANQSSWQSVQLTKELVALQKQLAATPTAGAAPVSDARRKAAMAIDIALEKLREGSGPAQEVGIAAAKLAMALLRESAPETAGGVRGRASRGPPPASTMFKENLDLTRFPTAVCNDGSGGAYYITEATQLQGHPAAADVWLVFLQGGGWCWDEASCAARFANDRGLMSSEAYPPTRQASGIFSPDPELSPFATANKVYIPYCSSDAFAGNIGSNASSLSSDRWHFRGQDLVKATLRALQMRAKNPLSTGDVLYFGGCSAGGRGAMFNFEYLHTMVPKGVRIYGVFDSVMWVDIAPLDPYAVAFRTQTDKVLKMTNASARLGHRCRRIYGDEEQWKCLFGQFRAPTITTAPFLVSASQYDSFQIFSNIGNSPPYNPEQLEYTERMRVATQAAMESINSTAAAFAPACFGHCITENTLFWTREVMSRTSPNMSLADFIFAWVADHSAARHQALETCRGFDCGCCSITNCARCNASRYQRVGETPPC
jgi:hypothetical protein